MRILFYAGLALWFGWLAVSGYRARVPVPSEEKGPFKEVKTVDKRIEDGALILMNQINKTMPQAEAYSIAAAVVENSDRYGLDERLVYGVILVESSGRFWVNNKGCLGLMQVKKSVWDKKLLEEGVIKNDGDYYRVAPAVKAGCYVLSHYMEQAEGDIDKALKLYSGGAGSRYMTRAKQFLNNSEGE